MREYIRERIHRLEAQRPETLEEFDKREKKIRALLDELIQTSEDSP